MAGKYIWNTSENGGIPRVNDPLSHISLYRETPKGTVGEGGMKVRLLGTTSEAGGRENWFSRPRKTFQITPALEA